PPRAMNDEAALKRPAPMSFRLDALKLLLRHARIMFERHGADRAVLGKVAHRADKRGYGADIGATASKARNLGTDVEILALNADHGRPSSLVYIVATGNSAQASNLMPSGQLEHDRFKARAINMRIARLHCAPLATPTGLAPEISRQARSPLREPCG